MGLEGRPPATLGLGSCKPPQSGCTVPINIKSGPHSEDSLTQNITGTFAVVVVVVVNDVLTWVFCSRLKASRR